MFGATKSAHQASSSANYIDDFFSTYLYNGNSSTQAINNGIDLAGKGGLVWLKCRNNGGAPYDNALYDTVRGIGNTLSSNLTSAQVTYPAGYEVTSFNNNGFSLGGSYNYFINYIGDTEASWTFAKQPKFFDVVTYTGTGSAQSINHSLGSAPGMIIVKRTDAAAAWIVYHNQLNGGVTPEGYYLQLQSTTAQAANSSVWNNTAPTTSNFSVGASGATNASGGTYVAYVFANNAGGFGATGTDNVISCGSYTGTASDNNAINLGYEPQYVLIKNVSNSYNWYVVDTMRGFSLTFDNYLCPNISQQELNWNPPHVIPTATGFNVMGASPSGFLNANGDTYIYMAIRRPMKPPTSGTQVFTPVVQNCNPSSPSTVTTGFPVDLSLGFVNNGSTYTADADRLRGSAVSYQNLLYTQTTNAEDIYSNYGIGLDSNTSLQDYHYGPAIGSASPTSYWSFSRRPGFFDEVCYTGTGSATTQAHNLGVVPELMIVKRRDSAGYNWNVYSSTLGASSGLWLNNTTGELTGVAYWNSTSPTSSVFSIGSNVQVNASGGTYVAYLFATLAGVSKVGSYTGTGGTQTINCGFGAGGARFILAKRTDSTGNWFLWDSANGLTSTSSPYVTLNTTNAQTTGYNGVQAVSTGFQLDSTASSTVNINGASYIFLSIA